MQRRKRTNPIKEREEHKLDAVASVVRKEMGSGATVLSGEEGGKSNDDGSGVDYDESVRKRRRVVNHEQRFKGEMDRFGKLLVKRDEAQRKLEERKMTPEEREMVSHERMLSVDR